MSPEQVRGLTIDHRSDVFAVGILFYEMVTGHRLFIGENDFSTLESVRNADVPPPTEYKPDLDPELEAVMLRALAAEKRVNGCQPTDGRASCGQLVAGAGGGWAWGHTAAATPNIRCLRGSPTGSTPELRRSGSYPPPSRR